MDKSKAKRIFLLIGTILVWFIGAVCIFAIVITVISKKDSDGTATIFGYQLRFVRSASMEKSGQTDVSGFKIKDIPVKSCIFVAVAPTSDAEKDKWYSTLAVGDVLTFKYVYARQETITHRIVQITQKSTGGFIIELAGDNRNTENGNLTQTIDTSATESTNYIIGKVTGQNYVLGLLIYALKNPIGIACIIIVPCLIIIAMQVIKIVGVYKNGKNSRIGDLQDKQSREIEELKRQLEAMQTERAVCDTAVKPNILENSVSDTMLNNVDTKKNRGVKR